MTSSRHLAVAVLGLLMVVGLGVLLLAWPAYRESAAVDRQADELRVKGEHYDQQAAEISRLAGELDAAIDQVENELKLIPEGPDLAGLMRVLSLPVDDIRVRDQMFDAGDPKDAVIGSGLTTQVTPLTIDMEARFDSVFALLRAAESMDRLLRVTSIKIVGDRHQDDDQPFTKTTVVLEAVYEPPVAGEDG